MDHIVRDALLLPIVGLTEREVGDLVAGRAAAVPATAVVAELHRATAGNPLFVDGVLRALAAEGRLGGARIDLAGFKLPDGVRGAIRRRLARLSADARALLTTAAVIGQESAHELLSLVHGHTAETLAALMGEAAAVGIVGVAGPSASRFTHPLLREALYDDLAARERTRLHRQVGAALESLHRANVTPCLAELAHHRAGAQAPADIEKAIDYAIRAGEAASAVFAYEGATEHFRVAVDSRRSRAAIRFAARGAVLPSRCGDHPRRLRRRHRLLRERPRPLRAVGSDRGGGPLPREARCGPFRHRPAAVGVARRALDLRPGARSVDDLRHAEALVSKGGDTPELAQLHCGIARNSFLRLRLNECEAGRRAMEIADRLHRSDLWAAAASAHAWNLMFSGRLGEAVALAETAWQTADREDDDGGAFTATYAGIGFCFGLHDFREAMRWARRELGQPRTAQSPFRRESIAQLMSNNTARLGDLTEARRLSPHSDRRFFRANLLLLEGQSEEAQELFESEIVESRSVGNLARSVELPLDPRDRSSCPRRGAASVGGARRGGGGDKRTRM